MSWHPDAEKQLFRRRGKPYSGGLGNMKELFHTTEVLAWPRYTSPPHLTLNPWSNELRQHIPFDLAAYSVRSGKVDTMRGVIQVEHWGKAGDTADYPDVWYENVAGLTWWLHKNLGVPLIFDDFTRNRYGPWGARLPYAKVDEFAGIIGHGRVGRGVDTHWDPGNLDTARLALILSQMAPTLEDDMVLRQGDKAFAVAEYQKAFNNWLVVKRVNYRPGPLVVDSDFGPASTAAFAFYQKAAQLDQTHDFQVDPSRLGVIDGVTADLLGQYDPDRRVTGAQGEPGEPGEDGDRGPQGPQGPQGPAGAGLTAGDVIESVVQ